MKLKTTIKQKQKYRFLNFYNEKVDFQLVFITFALVLKRCFSIISKEIFFK